MEYGVVTSGSELRLERGSALGDRLRRHWIPVMPLGLLERQHSRRVKVLGEDLVCYRDLAGTVGLIGARCPHRFVSLEWGVAAEVGLRCPYHGWCFDETGQCIDIPIGGVDMWKDVALPGYPVREAGGVVFAFLGDGEAPPGPCIADAISRVGDAEISVCILEQQFADTLSSITDFAIPSETLALLELLDAKGTSESFSLDHWESTVEVDDTSAVMRGERRYRLTSSPELSVSTRITFEPPFSSVIETGERRVVRFRVPLDDAHTLIMNHLSYAHAGVADGITQALDVASIDRYGAPVFEADASSDSPAGEDEAASAFSEAQTRSLAAFLEGPPSPGGAGGLTPTTLDRPEEKDVRDILEYSGFPSLHFRVCRSRPYR